MIFLKYISYIKNLNTISGVFVNSYFIISLSFYASKITKKRIKDKKFLRFLIRLYCFTLIQSMSISICYCKLFKDSLFNKTDYYMWILNFQGFYTSYMAVLLATEYIEVLVRDIYLIILFSICYSSYLIVDILLTGNIIYGIDTSSVLQILPHAMLSRITLCLIVLICFSLGLYKIVRSPLSFSSINLRRFSRYIRYRR